MDRISRDQMLMMQAIAASKRGTCLRHRVGAIISRNGRPVVSGYNGPLPGERHCWERKCDTDTPCHISIHAERNAILTAAREGIRLERTQLHSLVAPCRDCAELIRLAGIVRVVFMYPYRNDLGLGFLIDQEIETYQLDEIG